MKLRRPSGTFIILGVIWAVMLTLHLVLRLPDVWLWIAFPALFVPWLLLGGSQWFDR